MRRQAWQFDVCNTAFREVYSSCSRRLQPESNRSLLTSSSSQEKRNYKVNLTTLSKTQSKRCSISIVPQKPLLEQFNITPLPFFLSLLVPPPTSCSCCTHHHSSCKQIKDISCFPLSYFTCYHSEKEKRGIKEGPTVLLWMMQKYIVTH